MLSTILDLLACPVCHGQLYPDGDDGGELPGRGLHGLLCDRGHLFDVARQGYVSLLSGHNPALRSDTSEMVSARERVLGARHYGDIDAAVVAAGVGRVFLDVGAGTGHYLQRCVSSGAPSARGVGLDLSKTCARAMARAHPRIGAVVADAWKRLPIADSCVDTVLSVFAPRNVAEFARVLAPGGVLVVVSPTPRHLAELIDPMGMIGVDPGKPERIGNSFAGTFVRTERTLVEFVISVDRDTAKDLVAMGPSAHHLTADEITARAAELEDTMDVTASVTVCSYRVADDPSALR
ncbi:methyltransferase domain-containing protein [Williamsia sp. CHRR-6]|uniref:methyltransferase domain-containing protein n=1 Tax=Williamsia sp. CHRR-6 TaxID=2835871 RepID=UPI001BD91909|nr:methyltransferase domain-containing protein [Williamsia sp. CHRR-6]MBT0565511.1 methyltransferase domain-containing protein [Williamsia sp. CHRR-6]